MSEFPFVEVIPYKGKQIMFWSYPDGITQKELVEALRSQLEFSRNNRQIKYMITNFSNVSVGNEFMLVAKSNLDVFDELKSALLGITGLKKILLMGFNRVAKNQILPFDAKEEALEYLVND
ncbi:MAG: hypothetical protein AB8E82_17695 [Aureispira sp.]